MDQEVEADGSGDADHCLDEVERDAVPPRRHAAARRPVDFQIPPGLIKDPGRGVHQRVILPGT